VLYVVHCLDHENAQAKRLANYDDHKAYLSTGAMKTVVSGPVLASDACQRWLTSEPPNV